MKHDYFGAEVAASYDDDGAMFAAEVLGPTVDFLAALAGEGAALEFGIGTGRVALPLAERGVRVQGIDLSEAMVAKLRQKPSAERSSRRSVTSRRCASTGVLARLPRLQHDLQPDDTGRPGCMLPERG